MTDLKQSDAGESAVPSSARIVGFTGWNLFGLCAPMLVAFFSIPWFVKGMGTERFGALTLVWMLVGYFSILDLGMGRAMTKLIAECIGLGRRDTVPAVFWTALSMMTALGLFGAILLFWFSPWLSTSGLHIPAALREETRQAFRVVSFALPFSVAVTGLIGVLEAHQHFRLINIVRVPLGMSTYAAPLLVLPFTNSLVWVVSVLIAVRLIEFLIFFFLCLFCVPTLREHVHPDRSQIRPLLSFGGWMTVSNIALPLMIHIDRFVIGAVRTLAEVAYYANPAEIVVKMLILPRAWVSAMFPPLTMHLARHSSEADQLFSLAVKLLLLVLFPAVLVLFAITPEFLLLWIGPEFALRSTHILRLLSAGIFVYAMSYLAFALLQGAGRPDLSARWHLLELPLFLAISWWMTRRWGTTGMAIAWGARGVLDVVVLFAMALRFVPAAKIAVLKSGTMLGMGLVLLPGFLACPSLSARVIVAAGELAVFAIISWAWLLEVDERQWVRNRISGLVKKPR